MTGDYDDLGEGDLETGDIQAIMRVLKTAVASRPPVARRPLPRTSRACRYCGPGDPCPAHERDALDRADARHEPDDDMRERDWHYPRDLAPRGL